MISRRRRGRAEEGKAGDRLRPTPPGSSATRSRSRSRGPDPSQGSSRSPLGAARERQEERRHGRRGSHRRAACQEKYKQLVRGRGEPGSLRVRWTHRARSLPVMSRQISTTEGSEPGLVRWEAGRLDRLCEDPRWSADQRTLDDEATGWQSRSLRRQPEDTPPPVHQGAPESLREEDDGEVAQPELRPPCPHLERSHPAPLGPRGPCPTARGLGRSSAFFRYRSHSSFVDGRDACLVIVCLPAGCDERDPRHASASSAAADPRVAQQGHMKRRRIREDEPVGLVQIRSCPRLTEQNVERWTGRTSGPSCTWSKRRSRP